MLQRNGAALNPEQLELIQAVFCIARYLEEEGFLGAFLPSTIMRMTGRLYDNREIIC